MRRNLQHFLSERLPVICGLLAIIPGLWLVNRQSILPAQSTSPKGSASASQVVATAIPGAVGDGRADDTAALQQAIDRGGRIVLPAGIYRLSQPLVADLNRSGHLSLDGGGVARLVMAGPGPALRIVGTHFQSADPEGFSAEVWDRQRMPLIDGLAIVGEHPEACGIEAVGTMQLTITRTHIRHALHAIHLRENNRNVLIAECHLYENYGVGVYYDEVNLHQSNITGCHISYNRGGGIVCRGGNVRNIHVAGCDLESNMHPESPPSANVLIDCRGSRYGTAEVAITGCTIQHNNPSPDSANIRIIGRSDPAADQPVVREGHVTIAGNVLSDVQVNIHLQDCRGVVVTGNTMWQGYRHNLLLEDCSHLIVSANNLDRNPRYDYGNTQQANNSVVIRRCRDCTLDGLHVAHVWRDPAGVWLEDCRRMNIRGCTILDCDHAALWLKNVTDSRVSDCLLDDERAKASSHSLVIEGGSGILLDANLLGRPSRIDRSAIRAAENP
jgi:hypothetical protein